ncbi:MAG: alpha-hydroxy acid oxidase [Paracoccaceae bacterium]
MTEAPPARRIDDARVLPPPKAPRRLRGIYALEDLEDRARRFLPRPIFAYAAGGTERRVSLRDNASAFDEIGLITRVLRGVAERSTETELLGRSYAQPFGIAPMGMAALMGYRADTALAAAAREARIPMVISGSSLTALEEIAATYPDVWFQAYLPGEPERISPLLARVARAGIRTLVVTVDLPVAGNTEHYLRAGFSSPLKPSLRLLWDGAVRPAWSVGVFLRTLAARGMPHFENSYAERGAPILARHVMRDFGRRAHLSWDHIAQIRAEWPHHLIVKGMTHPADVAIARETGADAVWISNHGGRQLDGVPAPIRLLPEVMAAAPRLPVILDSGVRRGTDVLKACALGAAFVFVGRPFLYAAALGERAGVAHAIRILGTEIDRDMALLGIRRLAEIGPDRLRLPAAFTIR